MATTAYLLNARLYNTRGVYEYTRGVGNIAEYRLAELRLAENFTSFTYYTILRTLHSIAFLNKD